LSTLKRVTNVHFIEQENRPRRIWPNTVIATDQGTRKYVLFAFNVSNHPEWSKIECGKSFTLIFEGLDPECKEFDIFEDIPEPWGFQIENVRRKNNDVYTVLANYV
jgi:hypothetical protein